MTAALEGVRAVEFASYVAGPYAGMMIGDLGADIVKGEPPPHGDPFRGWESGAYSTNFFSMNRNKRSIVLDLHSPEGLAVARKLVDGADVLIENLRVGTMDRLGLGYEATHTTNPRLVYCSITGFGPSGPYVHRPGYDTVGQAMSGLLSLLTDLDAPKVMGTSLSDHLGGMFAAFGIMAGLAARERTGEGQRVDTSLLQASVAFLGENMAGYLASGKVPTRATRGESVGFWAFTDKDGAPFVIHLSSPAKFWLSLLETVERPDIADDQRFATRGARQRNRPALDAIFREIFKSRTREEWLTRLEAHDVPCSPLNTLDEVVADPQIQHLGMVREVTHPQQGTMRVIGNGILYGSTPTVARAAPVLNEDRAAILAELGFPEDYVPAEYSAGAGDDVD